MKVSSDVLYQHVLEDISSFLSNAEAPERNWRQFAAVTLKESLLKKYLEDGFSSPHADKRALDLFIDTNDKLISSVRPAETLVDQHLLGELKSSLERFWYRSSIDGLVSNLRDLFIRGRVGPGSCLGAKENDFYTKLFDCRLTTASPLLYRVYSAHSQAYPRFADAEAARKDRHGNYELVKHSKLLFVPKRNDISRTICVEPNLNMFFQLGLAKILEQRLREVYAIDLSTQPDFNRELARQGSIDGSYSTIDLSSASDSMSVGVLKEILPASMYNWLEILRTPNTLLPDGRSVRLNMISTMGNGFTFPLQTILFTAVVDSAYRVCGVPLKRNSSDVGNFAVFGDDIIVREEVTRAVLRLLWLLGFQVNKDKTFVEGPFRESCGYDWFSGHFVRGVYIKTLRTPQDRYVAINLLNDWSATTGICLSSAVQYLLSTVRRVEVSPSCGLDQGLHLPFSMTSTVRRNKHGGFLFRLFSPRPRVVKIGDVTFSTAWRSRVPNFPGLELAFLAGYVRSHSITLRQRVTRYVMRDRKSVV